MEDIASRQVGWGNMRIRERIAYAVKTRLLMNEPFIGAAPFPVMPSDSSPGLAIPHWAVTNSCYYHICCSV